MERPGHTTGVRILARYAGEVTTKAPRTRRRFQGEVRRNLREALASTGSGARIEVAGSRIVARAPSRAALDVATRVFGVASVSVVEAVCPATEEAIVRTGLACFRDRVRGRTFAVRARRRPRGHPSSRKINETLGAALDGYGRVQLDEPEVTVHVEVLDGRAYFFADKIPGGGGLPLGTGGRGVALLSGGFDSAVAAWMMLRRGMALDHVFCNLAGPEQERDVLPVAKLLAERWSFGSTPRLHVIDFETLVGKLGTEVTPSFRQIVLKRLMYRAAQYVARDLRAAAIVTGESLGQVSSQTAANLRAIDACVDLPVLRPLIGFDKDEIVARSRAIGVYGLSEKVQEHCALVDGRLTVGAYPAEAEREENRLDLAELTRAVRGQRVVDLRSLEPDVRPTRSLYVDEVPDGATVLDVRPGPQFDAWHYPGAVSLHPRRIEDDLDSLDPGPTYVLCCERGATTAVLADRMQRAGLEAYSFRGGAGALRRYASRRTPAPV